MRPQIVMNECTGEWLVLAEPTSTRRNYVVARFALYFDAKQCAAALEGREERTGQLFRTG